MQDFLTSGHMRGKGLSLTDPAGRPLGPARLGTLPLAKAPAAAAERRTAPPEQNASSPAQEGDPIQEARDQVAVLANLAAGVGLHFDRLSRLLGQARAAEVALEAADALEAALSRVERLEADGH